MPYTIPQIEIPADMPEYAQGWMRAIDKAVRESIDRYPVWAERADPIYAVVDSMIINSRGDGGNMYAFGHKYLKLARAAVIKRDNAARIALINFSEGVVI